MTETQTIALIVASVLLLVIWLRRRVLRRRARDLLTEAAPVAHIPPASEGFAQSPAQRLPAIFAYIALWGLAFYTFVL